MIDNGLDARRLANGLGWFSLGVGLALALASRRMARLAGVRDRGMVPALARVVGVREIASGIGVFAQAQPAASLWARTAGDVIDLTLLGTALLGRRSRTNRVALATAAVAGVTALDVLGARELSRLDAMGRRPGQHAVSAHATTTINRAPDELYRYWRDFTNLPRFMQQLESVRLLDERRSRWRWRGPAGAPLEWDSELTEDRPNERIAWRSLPGGSVAQAGAVSFRRASGGRGTQLSVHVEYTPPAGVVGASLARLLGQAPEQQLREDLRRFKQLLETGDIIVAAA